MDSSEDRAPNPSTTSHLSEATKDEEIVQKAKTRPANMSSMLTLLQIADSGRNICFVF